MYRKYPTRKPRTFKKRRTSMVKKRYVSKRRYYPKRRSVTPRLSPRGIYVPVSRADYLTLSNAADTIYYERPRLQSDETFLKFAKIYNKYRVFSITINVVPHQNSIFYFNTQGDADPLKYVIYRVSPDTIGTSTSPTSFKQAMTMPGAKAYNFSQSARRTRVALMGVVRNYLNNDSFTTANIVPVRQSTRTP